MQQFLTRIIIYGILILLIFLGLDTMATKGLRAIKDNAYYDINLLMQGEIREDIVAFGSSRIKGGINPKVMDSITKMTSRVVGLDGADCYTQEALWKPFLEKLNYRPKALVQTMGSLDILSRRAGIYDKKVFIPYLKNPYVYSSLLPLEPDLWKDRDIPLYKYRGNYYYFLQGVLAFFGMNFDKYTRYKGYLGVERNWDSTWSPFTGSMEGYKYSIDEGMDLLREEIELCRQKKVPFVLVFTPEQQKIKNFVPERTQLIQALKVLQKNNKDILYLDYSNWEHSADTTLFLDRFHLNKKGSDLFTSQLSKDMDSFLRKENR